MDYATYIAFCRYYIALSLGEATQDILVKNLTQYFYISYLYYSSLIYYMKYQHLMMVFLSIILSSSFLFSVEFTKYQQLINYLISQQQSAHLGSSLLNYYVHIFNAFQQFMSACAIYFCYHFTNAFFLYTLNKPYLSTFSPYSNNSIIFDKYCKHNSFYLLFSRIFNIFYSSYRFLGSCTYHNLRYSSCYYYLFNFQHRFTSTSNTNTSSLLSLFLKYQKGSQYQLLRIFSYAYILFIACTLSQSFSLSSFLHSLKQSQYISQYLSFCGYILQLWHSIVKLHATSLNFSLMCLKCFIYPYVMGYDSSYSANFIRILIASFKNLLSFYTSLCTYSNDFLLKFLSYWYLLSFRCTSILASSRYILKYYAFLLYHIQIFIIRSRLYLANWGGIRYCLSVKFMPFSKKCFILGVVSFDPPSNNMFLFISFNPNPRNLLSDSLYFL